MTTNKRFATTTGLFPLPDGAKETLRTQKGRQKDDLICGDEGEAVSATYDDARETVLEWQTNASLDRIVEGQLRWDDMLAHPLAVHDAVETGGLRRYYDNNNFYREVRVQDELTPHGDIAEDLETVVHDHPLKAAQVVLPGPVSLLELATDEYYGSSTAFLEGLTDFLVAVIESIPAVGTAFLLEPSLVEPSSDLEGAEVQRSYTRLGDAIAAADIDDAIVHSYWGVPPGEHYASLLETDGLGVGLDLITDRGAAEDLVQEYGTPATLGVGVVDGQNTRVESVAEIGSRLEAVWSQADEPDRLYLTPNTEGFYLPTTRYREKLATLGAAAAEQEVAQ